MSPTVGVVKLGKEEGQNPLSRWMLGKEEFEMIIDSCRQKSEKNSARVVVFANPRIASTL